MPKGRPTKYTDSKKEQAYQLARIGLTDEKMAKVLGISRSTFNKWKLDHPDFSDSVRRGKNEFDSERVEAALLDRALGFKHPDEKIFCIHNAKANPIIKRAKTTKHYPPDVGAINTWLHNRRPDRWKQKQEVTGSNGAPIQITILPEEANL